MILTLFQVGNKPVSLENIYHLPYGIHVTSNYILDIDKDIIQINNNKNIKLLSQNLINITLEACRSIG